MSRALVLFEDARWADLRPLTDTLPAPAIVFGASTLGARWIARLGLPLLAVEARAAVLEAWRERPATALPPGADDEVLVVNAAALPGPWLDAVKAGRAPAAWIAYDRVVAARLPYALLAPGLGRAADFERFLLSLGLPSFGADTELVRFPWHLVEHNPAAIAEDLADHGGIEGEVHPSAALLEPGRIAVARGARVDALAVLDARGGPIAIGPDAVVLPHTVVTGPCVVGRGTQLLGGFVGNSTFGPECRIAGEVDACVWQGHANKRHHGFVGHSVIGDWVNLGALTTTSDLKNNYGEVRVWVGDRELPSGSSKVGSILGAHVKTGIGTLLPTGASVGVGANLFGGGRFAPRRVAPFAWWDGATTAEHELEKFLATARVAMSRRGLALTPAEEALLRAHHDATRRERAPVSG